MVYSSSLITQPLPLYLSCASALSWIPMTVTWVHGWVGASLLSNVKSSYFSKI